MRKISLILVLTVVMISAFAAVALANPHGGYDAATDACASCHSVHNAKEAGTLLQWNDATEACLFCHNGTVSSYNVIKGELKADGQTAQLHGGLFAVYNDGPNAAAYSASQHDVFSSYAVAVYAAPGGKGSPGSDSHGSWSASDELTCGSCHEPHGAGGNPRLLSTNPNGTQNLPQNKVNGVQLGDTPFADVATTPKFWFADGKIGSFTFQDGGHSPNGVYDPGETVLTSTVTDGNGALLGDISTKMRPMVDQTITIKVGGATAPSSSYQIGIDTKGVFVQFLNNPGTTGVVTANYTAGIQVNMTITNKGQANETIVYGNGMQEFCAACHTDYAGSRSSSTAVYDTATPYHHSGNRANASSNVTFPQLGNYTGKVAGVNGAVAGVDASVGSCLTCHYSHGVDRTVWAKTATLTGIAAYDSPELVGSSNLKRLPNMGVCEVCHKWEAKSYSPDNAFVLKVNPLDPSKGLAWQNPVPNP